MKTLVLGLFGTTLCILIQIGVMVYGWGLKPQNWLWIIGMNIVAYLVSSVTVLLIQHK